MSRDKHENLDRDKAESSTVQSKDLQPSQDTDFEGFTANDNYEYEEPDRDIDYSSGYSTYDEAEEEASKNADSDDEQQDVFYFDKEGEEVDEPDPLLTGEPDDWLDNKSVYGDEHKDKTQSWPLGLIAVAAVALMLLAAGSYGVIQERADVEKELRQLRETLTTVAGLEDTDVSRIALQSLQESYDGLSKNAEALMRENRRLSNRVAALQTQLDERQSLLQSRDDLTNDAIPADTLPPAPDQADLTAAPGAPPLVLTDSSAAAVKNPVTMPSGAWFVNVGSYSTRAAAKNWAAKVQPESGKVIVAASIREGRTFYRVRVIGLADKTAASQVARQLEAGLGTDKLWVGREYGAGSD